MQHDRQVTNRISRTISALVIAAALAGCVSTPTTLVVERSDGLSVAPKWASFSEAASVKDGRSLFLGYVEVDGDAQKSAAFNMSDEKAMSEPLRSLVDAFLDQNQVGEELRVDDVFGRRIISATSGYRPAMPTLHIVKRYYEVVVVRTGVTTDQVKLRVFSLAEVKTSDFDRAKRAYFRRLSGDSNVKNILDEVGKKQIESVSQARSQTQQKIDAPEINPIQAEPAESAEAAEKKPLVEVSKTFPDEDEL